MSNFLFRITLVLFLASASVCRAQQVQKFNLVRLLNNNKLIIHAGQKVNVLTGDKKPAISCNGMVWLKGLTFSTGSIDVDLRGKDVFQQSFLGIAFHGIDTVIYDAIYFRPFNFQSTDTLRSKHQVQYISEPDYSWDRLRKEHPLVYEHPVIPSLKPTEWFHVHIVVKQDVIIVYVDHSAIPSLKVKKLNKRSSGNIALWTDGLSGDFANLEIISK